MLSGPKDAAFCPRRRVDSGRSNRGDGGIVIDQTQRCINPHAPAHEAATARARERNAAPEDHGFYSYPDAPGASQGSGGGGFLWFPDCRCMFAYIEEHLGSGVTWTEPAGAIDEGCARAVRGALTAARSADAATLGAVNRVLAGRHQITWWGRFGDLVGGEGDVARQLRADFRVCDGDEEESSQSGRPVEEHELDAFRGFLREYGQ